MTTNLIANAGILRVRITKRDKLEKESDAMIEQTRAISKNRILESLGKLTQKELKKIEDGLRILLNL